MKKQVLCMSVALAVVMGLCGNTHLVQEHISTLEAQLKAEAPYSKDRKKLVGYLRGYFNNEMHGGKRELKKLPDANTRRLANLIVTSYKDIEKSEGNHKQAATNYAQRAVGVVDLNVRPHGAGKPKSSMKKVQPTAAEPVAKAKKSGGWLQEMESMVGGNENAEPVQQPARSSVGRAGGIAAAGAAGAAAGTVAASRGQKAKMSAKKPVDPEKKQRKLDKKKKKSAAPKKHTAKKRTKPMSEKKKTKKAKKAAAVKTN